MLCDPYGYWLAGHVFFSLIYVSVCIIIKETNRV